MKKSDQKPPQKGGKKSPPAHTRSAARASTAKAAEAELKRVQNELERTRQYLQAVIREQESTNEELVTLNDQLQNRNAELSRLSDDLSNIFNGVESPFVLLDSERRIRRFNRPAEKLFGFLPGDIGRPIGNLDIGLIIPDWKELISSVMEKGAGIEQKIQGADGRWCWMRLRPLKPGERKIEGVMISFVDIHEFKQTQYTIEKERDLLSTVLDAARGLLVTVLDKEGRIVQFNRVCQELTGYSLEEVKGRRPWEFLVPADERRKIRKVNRENVGGMPNQMENHWVTKDGRNLLIGWSNSPVISDGVVESVVATGIDHTERAQASQRALESEATVRSLLETAGQAIIAVNRESRIVLANATTEKIFGRKRDELIGQSVLRLVPERFRQRHAAHMAKWFEKPRNLHIGAATALAGLPKDGSEFPIEVSLSYINISGETVAVAFVSDITERKKNEEELLDYQKQLQKLTGSLINLQETENRDLAREMHDAFSQELAALGMEVSNLLTSAELAGPLSERLGSLGTKIRYLADEMHRTSRRLHPAILSELGLEAALREECDALAQQCGIQVRFRCAKLSASLPSEVSLCLYRITQESLSNIRKYAGAKDVTVQLRDQSRRLSLRIQDTGTGFDVDEARKRGGLGLISMEERVRLVNGELDIRSKPGVGTILEVSVPLKEAGA